MYYQLGDIIFEALFGPGSHTLDVGVKLPRHNVIDGKPTLQNTGSELDERELGLHFHASFCNPEQEFAALQTHMTNGDILDFLNGKGVLLGQFVIEKLTEEIMFTDTDGNIIECDVKVSLVEYVDPTPLATKKTAAKNSAFGLNGNNPQTNAQKKLVQTPQHSVIASLQSAQGNVTAGIGEMKKASANAAQLQEKVKKAQQRIQQAQDAIKKAQDTIQKNISLATRTVDLVQSMDSAVKNTVSVLDNLAHGNLGGAMAASSGLSAAMGTVSKDMSPLSVMYTTKLSH